MLIYLDRKGNDFIYVIYLTKTTYYEIFIATAPIPFRINCSNKK